MSNLARKLHNPEIAQPRREQKKQQHTPAKIRFSKGEKFLFSLFVASLVYFSVNIIGNYADIYVVNKDIELLKSDIREQQKVTQDLQAQVDELSEYNRLLQAAREQGLKINEQNVKVLTNK